MSRKQKDKEEAESKLLYSLEKDVSDIKKNVQYILGHHPTKAEMKSYLEAHPTKADLSKAISESEGRMKSFFREGLDEIKDLIKK